MIQVLIILSAKTAFYFVFHKYIISFCHTITSNDSFMELTINDNNTRPADNGKQSLHGAAIPPQSKGFNR